MCHDILVEHITKNIIKRYCETRSNSVFDRFLELAKYLRTLDGSENVEKAKHVENSIAALSPFIKVLNMAQTDGSDWPSLYREFSKAVADTITFGSDSLAAVAEKRRNFLLNPVVSLDLYAKDSSTLSEDCEKRLTRWLEALQIPEFTKFVCDREFHSSTVVPRRLQLFIEHKVNSITVSEAAVERCFSVHKLIHSPMRSSISDDLVDDILFIHYNHSYKYNCFTPTATNDDIDALESLSKLDEDDD
jgi:hypothetical protein